VFPKFRTPGFHAPLSSPPQWGAQRAHRRVVDPAPCIEWYFREERPAQGPPAPACPSRPRSPAVRLQVEWWALAVVAAFSLERLLYAYARGTGGRHRPGGGGKSGCWAHGPLEAYPWQSAVSAIRSKQHDFDF